MPSEINEEFSVDSGTKLVDCDFGGVGILLPVIFCHSLRPKSLTYIINKKIYIYINYNYNVLFIKKYIKYNLFFLLSINKFKKNTFVDIVENCVDTSSIKVPSFI